MDLSNPVSKASTLIQDKNESKSNVSQKGADSSENHKQDDKRIIKERNVDTCMKGAVLTEPRKCRVHLHHYGIKTEDGERKRIEKQLESVYIHEDQMEKDTDTGLDEKE